MKTKLCVIMRRPCLPEDEGRHFFIKGPLPRATAEHWVALQAGEFFRPSDYYICEETQSRASLLT